MVQVLLFVCVGIVHSYFLQSTEKVFRNDDFCIRYSVKPEGDVLRVMGEISERSSGKAVTGMNIWAACSNANGTTSGTVPNVEGKFVLLIPTSCKEVNFLKYGYQKIVLRLNLE
ncbi:MAG: hypothetical protein KatS3mg032_2417 [Cyclobacteriaceae bacterium]|nr:MAG: hypothetical protein KatS3mg032_2417 [Cyclobacteriaceae bacterium]